MRIRILLIAMCAITLAGPALSADAGTEQTEAKKETRPLRIVTRTSIPTLDPQLDLTFITTSVLGNIFEALVAFDSTGHPTPRLAESWENPDNLTWRFTLRQGVRFHDGHDLDADSVATALRRAKTHPKSKMVTYLASVDKIETEGKNIVVLRTRAPDPVLLNKLAFVLIVGKGAPETLVEPIGTGPYRFVEHNPGKSLHLTAFEGYWGGESKERLVEILFETDPEKRVQQLLDGQVDLIEELPPARVSAVEDNEDLWVESLLGNFVHYLALDRTSPPFDKPAIREAVDLAINRPEIVREIFAGNARPANQIPGPTTFGYSKALDQPKHDIERARVLLHEAGFVDTLPQVILHHSANRAALAEILVRQLNNAGFEASAKSHLWPEFLELLNKKQASFVLLAENNSPLDAGFFYESILHSPSEDSGLGEFNFINFTDPETDRLIDDAAQQMDVSKREQLYENVGNRLESMRVILPLVWGMDLYGVRRDVKWRPRLDSNLWADEMERER